jgi:[acyl-carrier-protein] S-malonyltransferase
VQTILLFPGQGSQAVGMARDLFERYELARRRFAEAAEILGFDLAQICFAGPEDELRQTRATQPALYVHSCIITELLRELGIDATAAAGHSLGEYSALAAAGAFSFADGLMLVKARADAMQISGERNPGTMGAVVGLEDDEVRALCLEASAVGVVIAANFNSPSQVVVSGSIPGVRRALELAQARGAKIAKELTVSGAFHSPLMGAAAERLNHALSTTNIHAPTFPVISNVTAAAHTTPDLIRKLLSDQLLSPVRWTDSLHSLASLGPARWFEMGSGTVLSGLLKRTLKGASAEAVGTVGELERISSSIVVPS